LVRCRSQPFEPADWPDPEYAWGERSSSYEAKLRIPETLGLRSPFARLPRRALSHRFDAIYRANGSLALRENWLARNKHIACQTVISAHVPLDVYTLACNDDMYLAHFYGDIVKRAELGILDTSLVNSAPHPSFLAPSLAFLPNWWSQRHWLRDFKDERRRRESTGFVVTWADVEYYAVPPEDRPYLYNRVPAFLKVDPFDRLTPMPSVYYYLWHKIFQRGSASQRLLSDYLQAVAKTEWAAANAATWIHQAALGRRMMRLPAEVQVWLRQLGTAGSHC